MNKLFFYFLITIILSCLISCGASLNSLNDRIYESFKSRTKFVINSVETQFIYRNKYIGDIEKLRENYSKDTIIVAEKHRFSCDGCPAHSVQVFTHNRYKEYKIERIDGRYSGYISDSIVPINNFKTYNKSINGQYLHHDYAKIFKGIRSGKKIEEISRNNNSGTCFDGLHSYYTVIYPNNKIESMYIRCWKR